MAGASVDAKGVDISGVGCPTLWEADSGGADGPVCSQTHMAAGATRLLGLHGLQ